MASKELDEILSLHKKWLNKEDGGECANLNGVNLNGVNLNGADLSYANLNGANLIGANLIGANFTCALLCSTILADADLTNAKLYCTKLNYANLSNANLSNTNILAADLNGVRGRIIIANSVYTTIILGSYIAFGCKTKTLAEWEALTEEEAQALDGDRGVNFLRSNRFAQILQIAKMGVTNR